MEATYKDLISFVKLVYPDLSEQETEEKAKFYFDVFQKTSNDLSSFRQNPRHSHTIDNRQGKPL